MIDTFHTLPSGYRVRANSTAFFVMAALLFIGGLFITLWWGGQIAILRLVYPATSLVVAFLLFRAYPITYLGFTWWIWFLTPFIRRVVDLQAGWADPNPILLAPYLVTGVTVITFLKHLGRLRERVHFAFLLVLIAILIGYTVGVVRVSPFAATFNLLQWIAPVLLGFHLFANWQDYPRYRRSIQRIFVWGVLVLGVYALFQFFVLPEWDKFWMINSEMDSIGKAKPLEVRIFSTLNAPAPFAYVMVPGLLLLFNGRRVMNFVAAVPGYIGFMLALVRAAWGGWLIGVLYMTMRATGRARTRFITIMVLSGLIALPLLTTDAILGTVGGRAASLTNITEDNSLQARLAAYQGVSIRVLNDPIGYGMGAGGSAQRRASGSAPVLDSGLLDIALQLGWLGAFLYFLGLARLLWPLMGDARLNRDPFAVTAVGIVLSMVALLFFGKTQIGVGGAVLWCFLGLAAAGSVYHRKAEEALASQS